MIIGVRYCYDTEKRDFLPDEEDGEITYSCRDVGYFGKPSPDGKEWEVSTYHGEAVRVRYDGPVDQLATLVSEGGPELVARLNGDRMTPEEVRCYLQEHREETIQAIEDGLERVPWKVRETILNELFGGNS